MQMIEPKYYTFYRDGACFGVSELDNKDNVVKLHPIIGNLIEMENKEIKTLFLEYLKHLGADCVLNEELVFKVINRMRDEYAKSK